MMRKDYLLAAQDQGLMTNGFKKRCGIQENDKCRFCHTAVESSNHLMSGCQTLLADGHYTKRHNKVCSYIHWTICKEFQIPTKEAKDHAPEPVTAKDKITIFYDKNIQTGRFIENSPYYPSFASGFAPPHIPTPPPPPFISKPLPISIQGNVKT